MQLADAETEKYIQLADDFHFLPFLSMPLAPFSAPIFHMEFYDGIADDDNACHTRPSYRAGRKETAVKVYTVNQESRYLIVRNVPALGCIDELIKQFALYGPIEEYRLMDEEECEPYTDVYWIKFVYIGNARFAKRKLDGTPFLANLLKVTYAPEHESVDDTRDKLEERRRTVLHKIDPTRRQHSSQPATSSRGPAREPITTFGHSQRRIGTVDPLAPLDPTPTDGRQHRPPNPPQRTSLPSRIPEGAWEASSSEACPPPLPRPPGPFAGAEGSGQPLDGGAGRLQVSLFEDTGNDARAPLCENPQYFPLPSMNAAVASVREALDRTWHPPTMPREPTVPPNGSEAQPSLKSTISSTDIVGSQATFGLETQRATIENARGNVAEPVSKRPRGDNRRRI